MNVIPVMVALLFAAASVPGAGADTGSASCETTVGAGVIAVDASELGGVASIGGCHLVDLVDDTEVTAVYAILGCSVSADIDGDLQAETPVAAGTILPGGSRVWAFCDANVHHATTTIDYVDWP